VSKFEVGDKVWSPQYGWGEIERRGPSVCYPLIAEFPRSVTITYTEDGKERSNDVLPTLFHNEVKPEDWPNPARPEPKFVTGEPVMVQLACGTWYRRYFAGYNRGEEPSIYVDGKDAWTTSSLVVPTNIRRLTSGEMAVYRKLKGLDK
jgi:hypothetical protein